MTAIETTHPKTAFGEFMNGIRDFFRDAREERYDLQEAALFTRRAKHAVRNMSHGELDTYEAEEAVEMANDAMCEYEFCADSLSCLRIIPRRIMFVMLLAMLVGELFATVRLLDYACNFLSIQSDGLFYLAAFGAILVICVPIDLICMWLTYRVCNFIVKARAEKLNKISETLDHFLRK